jgi:hypothetical protein
MPFGVSSQPEIHALEPQLFLSAKPAKPAKPEGQPAFPVLKLPKCKRWF